MFRALFKQSTFIETRTMLHETLVKAVDLNDWSNRTSSKTELALLVRKLVQATVDDIVHLDIRTGEGTAIGGWDGRLEVTKGNEYVSAGKSVWEFGTNKAQKKKADEDYDKRKVDPGDGVDPAETTYIYVTSRTWNSNWAEEKKKEGFWKDVRVYEADKLHAWLGTAPSVHIWLTLKIGKRPEAAIDLEYFGQNWCTATAPPIAPALVLAGRDNTRESISSFLEGPATALSLKADSREEALMFLYGAIKALAPVASEKVLSKATVVESLEAWRSLTLSKSPLLLIPMFDSRTEVASAVQNGHHVFIPLGGDEPFASSLELGRLRVDEAVKVLSGMGIPNDRIGELAVLARRSFLSFRRRLAVVKDVHVPPWAIPDRAIDLIPFLFAGRWVDSSPADRAILEKLSGKTYAQLNETLSKVVRSADAPIRRVGGLCLVNSAEDLWDLISGYITHDDLARLAETIKEVFGTPDPNEQMTSAERFAAVLLREAVPSISGHLRTGLMEALALIAARSETTKWQADRNGQDWANATVYQLINNADKNLWRSIAPQMKLVAESAPDQFLEAVEASLRLDTASPLLGLFDEGEDPVFGGSSLHTHLLWALEMLAWHPDHLPGAALALARLTRLDPGGRLANRPAKSLQEIFLGWYPQTKANLSARLNVIDRLRKKEPEVAWKLMFDILPERRGWSSPTPTPKFRDWGIPSEPNVHLDELLQLATELVDRLVEDAGVSGPRWSALITSIADLPDNLKNLIIERLDGIDPQRFEPAGRLAIWAQLRNTIYRHRQFPDAEWAMPGEFCDRLERIYQSFTPADSLDKYAYLFNYGVEVLNPPDRKTEKPGALNEIVEPLREAAVDELDKEGGLARLLEAVERFPVPVHYGFVVGKKEDLEKYFDEIADRYLVSDDEKLNQFAQGYVRAVYLRKGWDWVKEIVEKKGDWSDKHKATFLANTDFDEKVWDLLEELGADADSAYWSQIGSGYAPGIAFERAARKLCENDRPHFAVDFLSVYLHGAEYDVPTQLALDVLESLIKVTSEKHIRWGDIGYDISQLLAHVQSDDTLPEERVATLEFVLTPILDQYGGRPVVLHRELGRNPERFVELMKILFRSDDENEVREYNPQLQTTAWALSRSWRTCPGTLPDGTLDREALFAWVKKARELLSECGRKGIGDEQIGEALAQSPHGSDGAFPHEFVRELIEELENHDIERGFGVRVFNNRGVTMRSLTEGGEQERAIAERYEEFAKKCDDYPRTAKMLRGISERYLADAKREDASAELTEDLAD